MRSGRQGLKHELFIALELATGVPLSSFRKPKRISR
jgi:hypothetical protein